jgi:hypothetical protein
LTALMVGMSAAWFHWKARKDLKAVDYHRNSFQPAEENESPAA